MSIPVVINKSLMPSGVFVERGKTFDLDTALQIGSYQVVGNSTIANLPKNAYNYGNLVVYGGEFFRVQEYYPHRITGGVVAYIRTWYNYDNKFTSWRGIAGTIINDE